MEAYGISKCSGPTHAPPYPPTNSAWTGSTGRPRSAMSHKGVPRSTSTTPGWATAPLTVTRQVPGSSAIPRARNGPGPWRAIRATWARVSVLCTRAGRLPMRNGMPLSGRKTGNDRADVDPVDQCRFFAGGEPIGRLNDLFPHPGVPMPCPFRHSVTHCGGDSECGPSGRRPRFGRCCTMRRGIARRRAPDGQPESRAADPCCWPARPPSR